jgi:hypothetical protein
MTMTLPFKNKTLAVPGTSIDQLRSEKQHDGKGLETDVFATSCPCTWLNRAVDAGVGVNCCKTHLVRVTVCCPGRH